MDLKSFDSQLGNYDKNNHNKYRRFLSQFIATTIKNFIVFDVGMCFVLPTIVIPALTGIRNKHNKYELLTITAVQASWLVAFSIIFKLVGSLLTGVVTDPFGRRISMIFVNIPFVTGFCMLYLASNVWEVFVGFSFLGFGVGVMEAPVLSYLGEVCEPSYRGVLVSFSYLINSSGMLTVFFLNTLMPWRTVCLVSLTVPIITAIVIFFIPETPQWLLSKNRNADAERSLRWLRGWVSSEVVAQEFEDLQRQSERSKSCYACIKNNLKCTHPLPTMRDKFAELKRKQTLKPFFITTTLFFLAQFTGIFTMKPFMVQIFKAYGSPIPADQAMAITSILENAACVAMVLLIRFTGKRKLYLFCMLVVLACSAIITFYGFTYLPPGYISFDQANRDPFHLENEALSYIPMICLMVWSFFTFLSIGFLPWTFLSELFSFKSRGIASGIANSMNYLIVFISNTIYYSLETTLSLPGVSLLFTCICLFGLILTYKILPETENRSLDDIELHFSDNSKGLTDRKIAISKRQDN